MSSVALTALVVTYNHEPYIAEALDSVLAQETAFDFEVLVSEDCSSDRTRAIVEEYAEAHPGRLRVLASERNLNDNSVVRRGIEEARGRYVALLDGDDLWSSTEKLRRQVDVLEGDPGCSCCFHNVRVVYEETGDSGLFYEPEPTHWVSRPKPEPVSLLGDIAAGNFIQTCSVVLRRESVRSIPSWYEGLAVGDWPLYVLSAQSGHLRYIDDVLATYRVHPGGVWTRLSRFERIEDVEAFVGVYDVLDAHLGHRFAPVMGRSVSSLYEQAAEALSAAGRRRDAAICRRRALARLPLAERLRRRRLLARVAADAFTGGRM